MELVDVMMGCHMGGIAIDIGKFLFSRIRG